MKRKKEILGLLSACFFFLFAYTACEQEDGYAGDAAVDDARDTTQLESVERDTHDTYDARDASETVEVVEEISEEISEEDGGEEDSSDIQGDDFEEEIPPSRPRLYVITAEQMQYLSGAEGSYVFEVASETEELAELVPGDIIVSSREWASLPEEFVIIPPGKLRGPVMGEDGRIGLDTEPASMVEALQAGDMSEGGFTVWEWITDGDTRGPDDDWIFISDGHGTLYDGFFGSTYLRAELNNVNLRLADPVLDVQVQIEGTEARLDLNFSGNFEFTMSPELMITAGATGIYWDISLLPTKPTWIGLGWIGILPVVVVVEGDLVAGFELETERVMAASYAVETSAPLEISVQYDRGWSHDYTFDPLSPLYFSAAPSLEFQDEARIKFYVTPEIHVKFYALAGPSLSVPEFYTQLVLDPEDIPCQRIVGGVSGEFAFFDVEILGGGIEVGQFTIFDWGTDIWNSARCGEGYDEDRDGYTPAEGDCDDRNPDVHPGAEEECGNEVDDDCVGGDAVCPEVCECTDGDGDGYYSLECRDVDCPNRTDCDDSRASVHPGAAEVCNGLDDDCDGAVDEGGVCTPDEVCNGVDDDGDTLCDEGFACCRGTTETQSCGSCGTQSRTCGASCSWGTWGTCSGSGVCTSGTTETRSCTCGGTESRTCSSSCTWGSWSGCSTTCSPGSTRNCTTSCSSTGTQTCAGDGCSWGTCVPPAETCNGVDDDCDGDIDEEGCTSSCPPRAEIISAGPWEGGGWYDLVINVNLNGADKYECIQLDWHGDDIAHPESMRYTITSPGTRTYYLGAYCISSSDTLQSVLACGCSGSYLVSHKTEIIEGTYDPDEVTFRHLTPVYDCP